MMTFIVRYWVEFLFGIIITSVTFLFRRLQRDYQMLLAMRNGVKALLKNQLTEKYFTYLKEQCIDIYEKEVFYDLYQEYKNLGGNGLADDMFSKIEALPLKESCGGD